VLIEVAESSLDLDRDIKGSMYARASIPIYWIINLVDNQVEVYTDPFAGRKAKYRRHKIYGSNSAVLLIIDGKELGRIPVRDLLPS
jgi:Uma2 family endonuclease